MWEAVQSGRYRALPSRRVYIPKADGKLRPLGIAAREDKIVQHAVVTVLTPIYEATFLGFSYGFCPGRGQHHALDALYVALRRRRVNWIVDADIRAFFDTVDHDWLMRFLAHRIADRRLLRLIRRWLTADVLEEGKKIDVRVGTPQGAVISPLLENIYLHYVCDLWVQRWRRRETRRDVVVVRYADDSVVGFEDAMDAQQFLAALRERLAQFGLALNDAKTHVIESGRYAAQDRKRRGDGRPKTFDFLGFTHICSVTRSHGYFTVLRWTSSKRMKAALKRLRTALYRRRHEPIAVIGAWLRRVVQGYFNYHAVPGNVRRLARFRTEVGRCWRHAVLRRGQRPAMPWSRFYRLEAYYLPPARVLHPYPNQRFTS